MSEVLTHLLSPYRSLLTSVARLSVIHIIGNTRTELPYKNVIALAGVA